MSRSAPVKEQGLTEDRIGQLENFRQGDFSEREKLALELTEIFATSPETASDQLFDRLKEHFTEKEIMELGAALMAFQGFHRWNVVIDQEPASADELTYTNLPKVPAVK